MKMRARLRKSMRCARYSQKVTTHAQGVMNHRTDEPESASAKNIDREPASRIKMILAAVAERGWDIVALNDLFSAPGGCSDIVGMNVRVG